MEAHLCLPTWHFPAMRHHKTVLVHSSVHLPALQAKVGPPTGAARVPVVGAGVVLSCALGAMYWKRARALQLPMHCINQTSHGGNGGAGDDSERGFASIKELPDLLSEICIRKIDPKPPRLTELIHIWLAQKVVNPYLMTSLLEEKFHETKDSGEHEYETKDRGEQEYETKTIGEHEYELGIVLILALISEKKYAQAKEICNQLIKSKPSDSEAMPDSLFAIPKDDRPDSSFAIPKDARPDLLLAIINMMMAMESMLQSDLKEKLEEVEKAWKDYKSKVDFQAAPPKTTTENE